MNFNFAAILAALGFGIQGTGGGEFRIANAARTAADYLLLAFFPERRKATYQAKSGSMTVRTTMAGLVGADSPYPPGGIVETDSFSEQTAKIGISVPLPEMALRELQQLLLAIGASGGNTNDAATNAALSFLDKVILQSMTDTEEYLRGEALSTGALDWTMNQKRLQVDYGIPAANLLAARTGTAGYGGSASEFWNDMRTQNSILKRKVRARLMHPDTLDMIVSNDANKVRVIAEDENGRATLGRLVGANEALSTDARDRVVVVTYGAEGEVLDPANRGKTIKVPFISTGKVIGIGDPPAPGFVVGEGSTDAPSDEIPLGYTHIGPTTENGGVPGRYARVFTPEKQPWSLLGEGTANVMPVIEVPEKLSIATTEMV